MTNVSIIGVYESQTILACGFTTSKSSNMCRVQLDKRRKGKKTKIPPLESEKTRPHSTYSLGPNSRYI